MSEGVSQLFRGVGQLATAFRVEAVARALTGENGANRSPLLWQPSGGANGCVEGKMTKLGDCCKCIDCVRCNVWMTSACAG